MDLLFHYHKHSYWVKQLLAGIIVVSTILIIYNSTTLIHNFLEYSSILFMSLLILGSVSGLKPYLAYMNLNKSEPRTLENNLLSLAKKMGSTISTYYPAKDYNSAFVFCGTELVIGENVSKKFSKEELEAVLAHEFSHDTRKGMHNRLHFLSVISIIVIILLLTFAHVSKYRTYIVTLAFFYIFGSQISWEIEFDCDENAVRYVHIEDLISAISKISEGRLDSYSFKHPSPNYRFRRLKSRTSDST